MKTSVAVVAHLADRIVARVDGEAPLAFLHAVLSQDVQQLRPGRTALGCYLDDKGRVRAEVRVAVTPAGDVLIDVDGAARAAILTDLARIAPLSGCSIEETTLRVTAYRGTAFPAETDDIDAVATVDDGLAIRVAWDGDGYDLLSEDLPVEADADRFEAIRIAAGRPRFGVDVTDAMLINETPYLSRAVSMTKGCYPGQESVARVHNLGTPRRRFLVLDVDGDPPPAGTPVHAGDTEVGRITSTARDGTASVALAVARADLALDAPLRVADASGRVRALA